MQPINAVVWFEIYVADMERAKAFYEAVFGRELMPLPATAPIEAMLAFPWNDEAPGAAGSLVKMAGKDPGNGGTLVYFACQDVADESAKAQAAGGQVAMPKMSIGEHGFIALVMDTEGNMIGLHSMS
jgi:hypothetical protein